MSRYGIITTRKINPYRGRLGAIGEGLKPIALSIDNLEMEEKTNGRGENKMMPKINQITGLFDASYYVINQCYNQINGFLRLPFEKGLNNL